MRPERTVVKVVSNMKKTGQRGPGHSDLYACLTHTSRGKKAGPACLHTAWIWVCLKVQAYGFGP